MPETTPAGDAADRGPDGLERRVVDLERRLFDIEDALEWERSTPFLRKLQRRVRRSTLDRLAPPLGRLRQHAPRPFRLPRRYRETPLPPHPPAICVVTPSFQSGRYLQRTAHSILDQAYPRLEYVVQDGGSTDVTLELPVRTDPRAHFASERDHGQAQAINRGFARSRGEIMAWLNADDLLLPGALAAVAGYFVRHPEVDVVYGHRILIDEDDQEIGRWVMPPHQDEALLWADFVPQETLFWRRSLWERAGGRVDERFDFAIDWDLLLRFRDAGAVFAVLPRFLGAFRVHAAQKTSSQMAGRGFEEIALLRRRCHGRHVTSGEAARELQPYLERAQLRLALHRLGLLTL